MKKGNLHIAILDDHPLILSGLIDLFKRNQLIAQTTTFEQPEDFKNFVSNNIVDVAIIDIRIFKSDVGLDMAKFVVTKKPNTKVLIYSGNVNISYISECLNIGVHGFISKDSPVQELTKAIEAVCNGFTYHSKDVNEIIDVQALIAEPLSANQLKENLLTPREIGILKLVCKGHEDKIIAEMLHISVNTVRTHRNKVLVKTNTHNFRELYLYATKNRLYFELNE
jgi:DNA-binding NarL/FixJ family response regulator